jgi:hypothetical protein
MKFTRATFNVLRSWSVVMVMVVMMIVMVMVMVVTVVVVMMVVILRHYDGLFFNHSSVTALVLSAQNLLGIGNGIQQLGKRLGGL